MMRKKEISTLGKIIRVILGLAVLFLVIGIIVLFSYLPPKSLVANFEASSDQGALGILKFIAGDMTPDPNYKQLPEILVNNAGEKITTSEQFDLRRAEMLNLFYDNVYGKIPEIDYEVAFEVLEETECFDGKGIRQQVAMTISSEYGESESLILMYLPKGLESAPIFVGLNFRGNTFIDDNPLIMTSYGNTYDEADIEVRRGERSERWPVELLLDSGYGLATVCANDFAPDDKKAYTSRLISVLGGVNDEVEIKAVSAWSFGLSRIIDYVITTQQVNDEAIISFGHSRMGKASLWTGAQDERVALTISNGSGHTGAALGRNTVGETSKFINASFSHWFIDQYDDYNNKVDEMPWDQHMLLAAIAPRKVYVASSERDLWAFPQGEYDALRFAEPVYELYGGKSILTEGLPATGTVIHTENIGYHIKDDRHKITPEDWQHFIDYADKYVK